MGEIEVAEGPAPQGPQMTQTPTQIKADQSLVSSDRDFICGKICVIYGLSFSTDIVILHFLRNLSQLAKRSGPAEASPRARFTFADLRSSYPISLSMALPSRKSWIGRPVEVCISVCGSSPSCVKIVAATSSGVTGSVACAMPEASVVP